jgi:hypothetical protein
MGVHYVFWVDKRKKNSKKYKKKTFLPSGIPPPASPDQTKPNPSIHIYISICIYQRSPPTTSTNHKTTLHSLPTQLNLQQQRTTRTPMLPSEKIDRKLVRSFVSFRSLRCPGGSWHAQLITMNRQRKKGKGNRERKR